MVEAPEKIWLVPAEGTLLQPGTTQQRDPWWDFDGAAWATESKKDVDVEYIRADIAERQLAERCKWSGIIGKSFMMIGRAFSVMPKPNATASLPRSKK